VLALASIRETHQSTTPDFPSLPGGFLFIDVATGSSFRVRYVSSGSLSKSRFRRKLTNILCKNNCKSWQMGKKLVLEMYRTATIRKEKE
jgi:hypothetical protein